MNSNASLETKEFNINFDNISTEKIGISLSLLLHLSILLFALGLPNFFKPTPINLPNVIPIEIINISEVTSLSKDFEKENEKKINEEKILEPKKFNSIQKQEIIKPEKIEKTKIEDIKTTNEIKINTNEKKIEKKIEPILELKEDTKIIENENIESLPTKKIKPKIKPKPKSKEIKVEEKITKDLIVKPKPIVKEDIVKDTKIKVKPKVKPEPEFSIASMLKDLRNEDSPNIVDEKEKKKEKKEKLDQKNDSNNENAQLSISEIDLLIQQLSSCWSAPAGAVIKKGMIVKISAKIQPNRRILDGSVRIVDTNIPQSNPFYGPITESAMRTLLNPECIPLKLPSEKYDLWKNLIITFDHSIMKGY